LAFALLVWLKLFPLKSDRTILDVDWLYRYFGDAAARWGAAMGRILAGWSDQVLGDTFKGWAASCSTCSAPRARCRGTSRPA
jgi:hypothetical protein